MTDFPPRRPIDTITLDRLLLRSRARISRYVLRHAEERVIVDHVRDDLIYEIASHVLSKSETDTYRIEEQPVYRSWRHHLIGSLPVGSWRRRFLTMFWTMQDEPLGKRVVHEVHASARCVFPDAEIVVPDYMGQPIRFAEVQSFGYPSEDLPQ